MAKPKTKKTPGKPQPPPGKNTGVVSFGKLFLHFVVPSLVKSLSAGHNQSDFELQVVFYSMNNSCGPMGRNAKSSGINKTYSVAEFPINVEVFEAAYESKVRATNTSSLTAEEFLSLVIESQFSDVRSIGYGMKDLYKSWDKKKPSLEQVGGKGVYQKAADQWSSKYGDMKLPMIEMTMDPETKNEDGKTIRRIHIYDRQSTPYEDFKDVKTRDDQKLYLERGVPVLTPGTNGSLIVNSTLSSKTDGTQGSIYLLRAMSTNDKSGTAQIANNGLEEEGNLPLRTLPVQMTLSTFGVPTARLYQTYFVDFDTGTTLDNLYVCTQIQHNITPGKFLTNWTFAYTSGYGKFSPKKQDNKDVMVPTTSDPVKQGPDAAVAPNGPTKNAKTSKPSPGKKK